MQLPAAEVQAQLQPLRRGSSARYDERKCEQRQHRYAATRLNAGTSVPQTLRRHTLKGNLL